MSRICHDEVIHYALVCLEGRTSAASGSAVAPLTDTGIVFCVRFMVDTERRDMRLHLCSDWAMPDSLAPHRALTCRVCTRTFRLAHNRALHMRRAHGVSVSARPRHPARVQADAPDGGSGASSLVPDRAQPPQPSPTAPSPLSSAGHTPLPRVQPPVPDVDRRGIIDAGARSSRPAQNVPLRLGGQSTTDDAAIFDDHMSGSTTYTAMDIPDDLQPATKKQRTNTGATVPRGHQRQYATLSTHVRSVYEDMNDCERTTPIVTPRKRCRPGRFNSYRLRALERFALQCGGAGLSLEWQERLYDLLDTWDGTKPGMPHDHGHQQRLRDAFPSANAFKDAIRDDVDDAVLEDGWRKCVMDLDGLSVTTFLCPALDVLLAALRDANEVQYWSGQNGPAPPTAMRETPFDGDAFRKNEEAVMTQHGPDSFVLGLHLFSDASHISESGGKREPFCAVNQRGEHSRAPYLSGVTASSLQLTACVVFELSCLFQ